MKTALLNARIYTGSETVEGKALLIDGSTISGVADLAAIPEDYNRVDMAGLNIAPGLIDLQIYGSGDKLFGSLPDEEGLARMEEDLLSQGTTGFYATSATNTDEVFEKVLDAAREYRPKAKGNFWGIHLEGPFLNPVKRGAHPAELIKKGSIDTLRRWIERGAGELKMMTVAPELQDRQFLQFMADHNILISAGHSNATYDQAVEFLNGPVQTCTHLFNAMPQIHHRDPGLVAAIFSTRAYSSIIADGLHVAFPLIAMAHKQLGDRLFIITDAVAEAREGVYQHIYTGDRYTMPDGTLSGSSMTMLGSVANCVKHAGIPVEEALRMASTYPARLIGKPGKGVLVPGADADIVVFDSDFNHKFTYLGGLRF